MKSVYTMAQECGLLNYDPANPPSETYMLDLMAFASMIAAQEREFIASMLERANEHAKQRMSESLYRSAVIATQEDIARILRSNNA